MTEKQKEQAKILIEKHKFCSLETQKKLQEAGFFEVCKPVFSIMVSKSHFMSEVQLCLTETPNVLDIFDVLPMPQFHEVWEMLPPYIRTHKNGDLESKKLCEVSISYKLGITVSMKFGGHKINICEAACKMWLKLKEQNLV